MSDVGGLTAAWELLRATRHAVRVELDAAGRVRDVHGDLDALGLSGLAPGAPIDDVLPALAVGTWPSGAELLPRVDLGHGRVVDLCLAPRADGGLDAVLLDASHEARLLAAVQQRNHELELLRRAHDRPRQLVDTALLGLRAALFQERPGGMVLLAPAPEWLSRLLGTRPQPGQVVPLSEHSPFLEHFLDDARAHWDGTAEDHLRSGPFVQTLGAAELPLEAIALHADGQRLLLVQRLEEGFEERRHVLQAARSSQLEHEGLRREIQKKDLLLHCIVHDLNAPLSSLAGALALLAQGELPEERAARLIELSQQQTRKQMDMVRQVLEVFSAEVASMESFDSDPRTAPDLAAALRRVGEAQTPAFLQQDVRLELSGVEAPVRVVGREDRLDRVIGNLLENARRHTPRGSTVRMTLASDDERARVCVDDEGPGVAPEVADHLFEKFGQGSRGGVAGLGLYFCRFTVQQWGGAIGHERAPGGGARFVFELPRAR